MTIARRAATEASRPPEQAPRPSEHRRAQNDVIQAQSHLGCRTMHVEIDGLGQGGTSAGARSGPQPAGRSPRLSPWCRARRPGSGCPSPTGPCQVPSTVATTQLSRSSRPPPVPSPGQLPAAWAPGWWTEPPASAPEVVDRPREHDEGRNAAAPPTRRRLTVMRLLSSRTGDGQGRRAVLGPTSPSAPRTRRRCRAWTSVGRRHRSASTSISRPSTRRPRVGEDLHASTQNPDTAARRRRHADSPPGITPPTKPATTIHGQATPAR